VNNKGKIVAAMAIMAVLGLAFVFVIRDFRLHPGEPLWCREGPHPRIDLGEFTSQYWAYSVKAEAAIADRARISRQLDPAVHRQVSEALQQANEFRKYVVAGYNTCAITPGDYAHLHERFRTLDNLARQIDSLVSKPSLSRDENQKLAGLVGQYSELVRQRVLP